MDTLMKVLMTKGLTDSNLLLKAIQFVQFNVYLNPHGFEYLCWLISLFVFL